MKRLLWVLLLMVAANASAIDINPTLSGSWYNLDQDGHGLNIEVLNDKKVAIYWYAYHTDGTPMWLVTIAKFTAPSDTATGTTYYNTGMTWGEFDPLDRVQTEWGTSTITFHDCYTATLEYTADDAAYGSGTIPMERLTYVAGVKCSNSPLHGNYIGSWASNGEIGYGVASMFADGTMVFWVESDTSAEVGSGTWWTTSDHTFQFQGYSYSAFGGESYIAGSGNYSDDDLVAYYTGGGYLFAAPMQSFQHALTTKRVAGDYDIYDWDDTLIGSVTIQDDGALSGSTNSGCQVSGNFIVPDTWFNQALLEASLSDCSGATSFEGAAIHRRALAEIVIAANDSTTGYTWTLKLVPEESG